MGSAEPEEEARNIRQAIKRLYDAAVARRNSTIDVGKIIFAPKTFSSIDKQLLWDSYRQTIECLALLEAVKISQQLPDNHPLYNQNREVHEKYLAQLDAGYRRMLEVDKERTQRKPSVLERIVAAVTLR